MPRLTISEGIANGLGGISDLIDAIGEGTTGFPSFSPTELIYFNDDNVITIIGTGFGIGPNGPTADSLTSIRIDHLGTEENPLPAEAGYFFDQLDFEIDELFGAFEADDSTNPAAVEQFLGSLDWTIIANDGDDVLTAAAVSSDGIAIRLNGDDNVDLGDGFNNFFAAAGDDTVLGGADNDTIQGGAGDDSITGGGGMDRLLGGNDSDTVAGNAGEDTLVGQGGDDRLNGGTDDDFLSGGAGNDTLFGANGDDVLVGGANDDRLIGGGGTDRLVGGFGNDFMLGGGGDDLLNAQGGDDTLGGGTGNDRLRGGAGADVFVFAEGDGFDRVLDFEVGVDTVLLSGVDSGATSVDFIYSAGGVRVVLGDGSSVFIAGITETGPNALDGFDQTDDGIILF